MFDGVKIQSRDIRARNLDIRLSGVTKNGEHVGAILSFGISAAVHIPFVLVLLGSANFVGVHISEGSLLVDQEKLVAVSIDVPPVTSVLSPYSGLVLRLDISVRYQHFLVVRVS